MPVLVALLVCLIPTTIGALISAIGIAGMDRLVQHNVLAMSGRSVEAAGDVDTLLLDKTGTITLGNRQAVAFIPAPGVTEQALADAAQLASLADETPEGRSIVVLAKKFNIRARELSSKDVVLVPFSAQTRMSGITIEGRDIRKGAADAIEKWVQAGGSTMPADLIAVVEKISRAGGTPLVVAENGRALGAVQLKDIVKGGIRERFDHLRAMGIKTVMITGDNPLTAAAIASEAGVDDFMAQATPEDKLKLIRKEQANGRMVAMTGDGTNDAPALAQADVGVAMNSGTSAAKEAGNMVDLDSNPTKLIEIVEIGKQLLMTRGALTTFSIANDVAKYFAIIPAMFILALPQLAPLNIMRLATPESAILSAVIFNAADHHRVDSTRAARHPVPAARRRRDSSPEHADLRGRWVIAAVHRHQGDRRAARGAQMAVTTRPDPEALLRQIKAAEREASAGRLKIFLGYASGVGKSFRLFDEGRRRRERGEDVIVAAVQDDMPPEVAEIVRGLEQVPTEDIGGVHVIDVPRVLSRKPQVCLIDGLAYDNPPGSRHPRRSDDVQELVDAGISVITTLNLEYVEDQKAFVKSVLGDGERGVGAAGVHRSRR